MNFNFSQWQYSRASRFHRPVQWFLIASFTVLLGCEQSTQAPEVIAAPDAVAHADQPWPSVGGDASEQRFSPLDKVNTGNVERLGLAWSHEFDTSRGQEATPVIVDGVLFTSTAWSKVYAFNAASGELKWSYDPEVPGETAFNACCDVVNRGVAVADGRVFVGTLDGRLIALEASSGQVLWSTITVDQDKPYTITGAPRVVRDKVLIGNGGAELGVRGYLSAYHAGSGELAWRFYTTPNPDGLPDNAASDEILASLVNETWSEGEWKTSGGGGTVWDSMAWDPDLDLLYFGVGNGTPWDHTLRSGGQGDNLFLSSIVAVRPDTGEYVWHYQTTPGENWDYTATQQIVLADIDVHGESRKVLMQAPKNGFFYVLDRTDGSLISAENYVTVTWASGIGEDGRPIEVPEARYNVTGEVALVLPSPFGGHNWHPMSYDADRGLVYIPAMEMAFPYSSEKEFGYREGQRNIGLELDILALPDDPDALQGLKDATIGKLIAWDPVARKARWSVDHPHFWNAGVLATAGGLVFQGNAEGDFVAYSADGGERLWEFEAGNGIIAAPAAFEADGRQYIAVLAGYGGAGAMIVHWELPDRPRLPGRLLVFALDGEATIDPYDTPKASEIDLVGVTTAGDAVAGLSLFHDNCLACHGASASGRYLPDLKTSSMLLTEESFRSVVLDGALADRGMVGFSDYLDKQDVESIRAYILEQARK